MTFVASTNISGTNPGPNPAILPDTVQMATGNAWKLGIFTLTLGPATVATTTSAEQTFAATGIGLLTTDFVWINASAASLGAGVSIASARVSASDTLAITFANVSAATATPATNGSYKIFVARIQPNWTAPASGSQLDW